MPEYLAPGVYVEEVDTGPKPIEGVSTSTSGMVGVTERGPENIPTLVVGYADFVRQFGDVLDDNEFANAWYLPHAVKGFFDNGGKRLYIVRVLPGQATYAGVQLYDRGETLGISTTLASRAEQGDGFIVVAAGTGITSGDTLLIEDGSASEYHEVSGRVQGLRTPLTAAHPAATPVMAYDVMGGTTGLTNAGSIGDMSIVLDDTSGLSAGGDLLRIGTSPNIELVTTTSADPADATVAVQLAAALTMEHDIGADVSRIDTATAASQTTLTQDASAGDTMIAVAATVSASDVIGFGATPSTDFHLVLTALGTVESTSPLTSSHSANDVVVPLTEDATVRSLTAAPVAGASAIVIDDRTGLAVEAILKISEAGTDEYVVIDSMPAFGGGGTDPGTVQLKAALTGTYTVAGAVVKLMNEGDEALLMKAAAAGETVLFVSDTTNLAGSVVRIDAKNSAALEFQTLAATTTSTVLALTETLSAAHVAGLSVEGHSELIELEAIDRGAWGNDLKAYAADEDEAPLADTTVAEDAAALDSSIKLSSVVGIEPGSILEFYDPLTDATLFTQKADDLLTGNRVVFDAGLSQAVFALTGVRTREFKLTVQLTRLNPYTLKEEVVPGMSETHRHLSLDPRHSRYAITVIGRIPDGTVPLRADGRTDGESDLVRSRDNFSEAQAISTARFGPDIIEEILPDGRIQTVKHAFDGGDDAASQISDTTYKGVDALDPNDRTGLYSLKNIEEISIVAIPGRTSQSLQQELITHCELLRYRFAVLDPPSGLSMAEIQSHRGLYDTKYAAIYYPWLVIEDPFPENPRIVSYVNIPPSGHMIGIYARSDIERGVHKAPANEVIRGINELEISLMKEHQDILNPRNINVLRNFRSNNRGLRVWGARVMTSDPDWKYVNVRRLFIFIEHSIDRGTQWVVFEPNSEALWERVRRVVSSFLLTVWRDGALMGKTAEEAFFVKCDRSTMTQADIDNGKLIVLVGIAPVKPAEFVIFRIGQKAGGSELDEG
jgi:uncharacterized protein